MRRSSAVLSFTLALAQAAELVGHPHHPLPDLLARVVRTLACPLGVPRHRCGSRSRSYSSWLMLRRWQVACLMSTHRSSCDLEPSTASCSFVSVEQQSLQTMVEASSGRSCCCQSPKIIIESAIVVVIIIMKLIRSHRDIRTPSEKQEKQARETREREKIRRCSTRTSNQERALEELEEASMCQVSIHEHKSEESVVLG